MSATSLIRRACKGGCGQFFTPPATRPGQEYVHGHKNGCDWKRSAVAAKPKQIGTPAALNRDDRRKLDYRMALQTAHRHLAELTSLIDQLDDHIDDARKKLHALEAEKETLTARHLTVDASIMALDALVTGKNLAAEIAKEQEG